MKRPWFADGTLFDELDIRRWQLHAYMVVMWTLGFTAGLAWP